MDAELPVSATDNYTPTTEEVRWGWWSLLLEGAASSAALEDAGWEEERSLAQFDRWLAAERAEAWDESMTTADIWYQERLAGIPPIGRYPANPYREVQ